MRMLLPAAAVLILPPAGPAHGAEHNLFFYEARIGSLADCHAIYTAHTPDWTRRENFIRRVLPDGREVISQCVADGVTELHCDAAQGRSVLAVLADETVPVCSALTPGLPVRLVDSLLTLR